jgi:hypothetical protein
MVELERAKRQSGRVTGVSNVAYDLMVVLTNKLEGIAAMEEYKLDAEAAGDQEARALFEQAVRREREAVDEFRELHVPRLQRIQRGQGASAARDVLAGSRGARRAPPEGDALVDEASADSFPASDPPPSPPGSGTTWRARPGSNGDAGARRVAAILG